jgi:hypothetical protein
MVHSFYKQRMSMALERMQATSILKQIVIVGEVFLSLEFY